MSNPQLTEQLRRKIDEVAKTLAHTGDLAAFADSLKAIHDQALAEHAHQLMAGAFPDHEVVIFARNWDEDAPHLLQVLTSRADIEEYDGSIEKSRPTWMTRQQWAALIEAERSIAHIGSDDEILQHLDPGETEHEDWTEFQLNLR